MKRLQLPQNLTALAYQQIKQYILEGRLDEGARLTEEFVSQQLGISKSPVREAFNRLESEGLIRIEPRRGAFLNTFSVEEIRDLYDLREALEVHAVRTVRVTPRLIRELKESVRRQRTNLEAHNKTRYIEEDIHFHELIARETGNSRLVQALANLQNQLTILRRKTYDISSSRAVESHTELCAALSAGDHDRAQDLMREHIAITREKLVNHIAARESHPLDARTSAQM